ncbi:MAG: hypothetical protein M5U15_02505 [Kiritimatiellae bacterium]|nr:hypothetical protein [Kiritimatiellia bacterium]
MRTVLQLQTLVLAAGIILTAAACSRQRSRALEEPRVPEEEGRNYQEMLDRVPKSAIARTNPGIAD